MSSIPLYVMRGTCFLLQYAIFYCVLFSFRVFLRGVTKLLCFHFYRQRVKPVNGTQVRIIDIFLIDFYFQVGVYLLIWLTKENLESCVSSRGK